MLKKTRKVALIPARSGSKRIKDKNIKILNGHPLIAYTITAAIESNIFDDVICATDSEYYAEIARYYGAEVPFLRAQDISKDKSPDIDWVYWILDCLKKEGRDYDMFSILRPTSPFRLSTTIKQAYNIFDKNLYADSLRAVEKCKQHPGKMWVIRGRQLLPLMPFTNNDTPWHSNQYNSLPLIYVQNASLEIAWTKMPLKYRTIAGETIIPYVSQGLEGFDINYDEDFLLAERYLLNGQAKVQDITKKSYKILK